MTKKQISPQPKPNNPNQVYSISQEHIQSRDTKKPKRPPPKPKEENNE